MKTRYYKINGVKVKIENSDRKDKQLKATLKDGKTFHFGDKEMPEYPNTKRGDNYCSRSKGIKSKGNINANVLSRKILWNCKGKKSLSSKDKAGATLISMEDFYD